jgi:hypothetical protein
MKPEFQPVTDAAFRVPVAGAELADLRIECVSFDTQGAPKRRRVVSLLSMLRPPRQASQAERRAALMAAFRDGAV